MCQFVSWLEDWMTKKEYSKAKGKTAEAQTSKAPTSSDSKNRGKEKSKGKDKENKPSAKTGDVDFDDAANDVPEEEDNPEWAEEQEEPEENFADAQTSESETDFGCMPDSSASECTYYKACAFAPAVCASPQKTLQPLHDTWEWRGPCCLVRVHRQVRRCLYTPIWEESMWQGLTVQPQHITHVTPTGQSGRT